MIPSCRLAVVLRRAAFFFSEDKDFVLVKRCFFDYNGRISIFAEASRTFY
ncbi:MAG: hypothetical protein ACFWUD_05000 [Thermocaproicibacter melissae]|jgi:hypothetical protein